MVDVCSRTGGHIGAGLGVVELTIALHYVFDTPRDQLVWDVGHQGYPHKLLTGRNARMETLRQEDGISGFLKRTESEYDTFGAGHAATAISAALGMAAARDINGEELKVVAILGDGALTLRAGVRGAEQRRPLRSRLRRRAERQRDVHRAQRRRDAQVPHVHPAQPALQPRAHRRSASCVDNVPAPVAARSCGSGRRA